MHRTRAVIALAAVLLACEQPMTIDQRTVQLEIVSGDGQTGVMHEELPDPLVVRVVQPVGATIKPVAGQIVNFRVLDGGGTVFGGTAVTDKAGIAQDFWTLGDPGPQRLEARAVAADGEKLVFAIFEATALSPADTGNPGPPTQLVKLAGDNQVNGPQAPVLTPLTVAVRDASGNAVPRVRVAWSMLAGGRLADSATVTDAAGEASNRFWLGAETGTYTVVASVPSAPDVESVSFTAEAVPPLQASGATSTFTLDPSQIFPGDTAQLSFQARDPLGNPLTLGGNRVRFFIFRDAVSSRVGFFPTEDHGDGTYSARVLGIDPGLPIRIRSTIDDDTVTASSPAITVLEMPVFSPTDAENMIAGAFRTWWLGTYGNGEPSMAMSTMADEATMSWQNFGIFHLSSEPRVPFNNSPSQPAPFAGLFARRPWFSLYSALSDVYDALRAIDAGMEIGGPGGPDTPRARAFAKFVQGMCHGWLALQFDSAFVLDETIELDAPLALQGYPDVWPAADGYFQEAIAIATANPFQLPQGWIGAFGNQLTNTELVQLIHSQLARWLPQMARNPDQRAAVDWNAVIARVDQGLGGDFFVQPDNELWWSAPHALNFVGGPWSRADYKTIGQYDASGGYDAWLETAANTSVEDRNEFQMPNHPDARIQPPGSDGTGAGTDFAFRGPSQFIPQRGTYHFSMYGGTRYQHLVDPDLNLLGPMLYLPVTELQLNKVEGLLRLGGTVTQQIVDIVNATRVGRGGLPALTTGASFDQVLDAIIYERRIETYGICSGCAYFNRRGEGPLAPTEGVLAGGYDANGNPIRHHRGLVEGTPLHFAPPGIQLAALGIPIYTYGGVGTEGPATAPAIASFRAGARARAPGGTTVPAAAVYRSPNNRIRAETARGGSRVIGQRR